MNDFLPIFKQYLFSRKHSAVTVKNYLSDISRFIRWFEQSYTKPFDPQAVSINTINLYQKESTLPQDALTTNKQAYLSARTMERHVASLRRFFSFLREYDLIQANPFDAITSTNEQQNSQEQQTSPSTELDNLRQFKDYLYLGGCSSTTIKNYLHDIKHFIQWVTAITQFKPDANSDEKFYTLLTTSLIEEYKNRLLNDAGFSPISINRKLSSLRKYLTWLYNQGIIGTTEVISGPIVSNLKSEVTGIDDLELMLQSQNIPVEISSFSPSQTNNKSRFAPVRIMQTLVRNINYMFDTVLILPLARSIEKLQYIYMRLSGKSVFTPLAINPPEKSSSPTTTAKIDSFIMQGLSDGKQKMNVRIDPTGFTNISKSFYDPLNISTEQMSLLRKIWHNLRHNRPQWYKGYHEYRVVHYLHFALLLFFIFGLSYAIYPDMFNYQGAFKKGYAILADSPPGRFLSFQGTITGQDTSPLTAKTPLRFAIYNSPTASGSALLWQEIKLVQPSPDGKFKVELGRNVTIPRELFDTGQPLYLGVSIKSQDEMRPRQQLSTASFAADAEHVQGLVPITAPNAGSTNVLLALDSSGNLAVGGEAGTTFSANEGAFTLTGQTLILSSNLGSNGDIQISPDGYGRIDLQKPLVNTTLNNSLSQAQGAVEVDDLFAVLATSSAQPAVLINQDGTGNLLSASSSGISKFTVDFLGNGTFEGNLAVNGGSLTTTSPIFSLANTDTQILNIGGDTTVVTIGGNTGQTTINHDLRVNGNLYANFVASSSGFFGYWQRNNGVLSSGTVTDAVNLGSTATSSAVTHLAGKQNDNSFFAGGNLGIGTNDPSLDRLHVYGNIRVGTSNANGCLKAYDGTAIAGTCSSDIRLKKNISAMTSVLDKVAALQPVSYTMRSDEFPEYGFGTKTAYGLIAQDVEKLFPELVGTDERGLKTVNYGTELTMLNLAAIKELYQGLHTLKDQLSANQITSLGDILIEKNLSGDYQVIRANNITITAMEAFAKAAVGQLSVGYIHAKEGTFETLAIMSDRVAIAGVSMRDYILNTIEHSPLVNRSKIMTPLLAANNVQSNFISPLSSDSMIGIGLDDSEITIKNSNTASGSAVARFDRSGNATFSGTLQAQGLTANNASVSGTLHAGKIIADEISGLDDKLASLSSSVNQRLDQRQSANTTNIYNIYNNASNSARPNEYISTSSAHLAGNTTVNPASALLSSDIPTEFADIASISAALAYVPHLNTDFSTVHNGLMVFGSTSLADTAITGQLSINGSMILTDNSINVLGSALELQPLRQGILSMMGGLVAIDTDGNLTVGGNAVFAKNMIVKGTLATSVIAPVPGSDLIVQLPGSENSHDSIITNAASAERSARNKSAFIIKNASGSGVLSINNVGDVIASGTAAFKDVVAGSLNIVRGVQADTSAIDTVASGSAGISTITAGYTSRTIYSPYVKKDSLIYVSPRSETTNAVPYLARQIAEDPDVNYGQGIKGSFTVEIPNAVPEDISFNWWIVN